MPCAKQPKPKVAKVKRDLDFGKTPKERREVKSLVSRAVATELERGTIGTWSDFDAALKSAQGWVPTKEDSSNEVPDTVPSMPRYGSKSLRNAIRRQRLIAKRRAMNNEVRMGKKAGLGSKLWYMSVKRLNGSRHQIEGQVTLTRGLASWFQSYYNVQSDVNSIVFLSQKSAAQSRLGRVPKIGELRRACLKNRLGRAPGPNGVRSEVFAYGGKPLHRVVTRLLCEQ